MDNKTLQSLEQAKAHFYSLRLVDAYHILRRYFDRLPFKPEKEHAEYMGIFARTLVELGKENELKFYLGELEKLRVQFKSPLTTFQLAVVYGFLTESKPDMYRKLLEEILRDPEAEPFHVKAKIDLARYYEIFEKDVGAIRRVIDSIHEVKDESLVPIVEIWRAYLPMLEKNYGESEEKLISILEKWSFEKHWYAHFSAKLILTLLYIDRKELDKAAPLLNELQVAFEGKKFRTITRQLETVTTAWNEATGMGKLILRKKDNVMTLVYQGKSMILNQRSMSDKLLLKLMEKNFLNKAFIAKNLFEKEYNAERDDKSIYYNIHLARKRLKDLGLPGEALVHDEMGYRLVPAIEIEESAS
jgi:hypothetical protein